MKLDVYRLRLFAQWTLGWHEAWAMALVGLGPEVGLSGWGHRPCCWVEV